MAKKVKVRRMALCEKCINVRWRTGSLPSSRRGTHPMRLGRVVRSRRKCLDCDNSAIREYRY